jgi:hypothetical protein
MPDDPETRLTLRQANQPRADFYAIQDDLEVIMAQALSWRHGTNFGASG